MIEKLKKLLAFLGNIILSQIPKPLINVYNELIAVNLNHRPNPADVITKCRKYEGYFKNDLIDSLLFLEEIHIKEKHEKSKFFSSLTSLLDHFPAHICRYKILPHLINAFEYGEAGAAVLTPLLKVQSCAFTRTYVLSTYLRRPTYYQSFYFRAQLGNLLDDSEYQKKIVPCVIKLFNCNDRATRCKLLQQMENYIGLLFFRSTAKQTLSR